MKYQPIPRISIDSLSLAVLIATIVVLALLLAGVIAAGASTVCLTKQQARHLWPRQHIYWYSKDRCWSNRHGPPRGLKLDPIAKIHAQAPEEPNEIDAHADDPAPLIDIDEARPFGPWEERIGGQFAGAISK